jgi:hypothetical protein
MRFNKPANQTPESKAAEEIYAATKAEIAAAFDCATGSMPTLGASAAIRASLSIKDPRFEVIVSNGYDVRDTLRAAGMTFDGLMRTWSIKVDTIAAAKDVAASIGMTVHRA